MRVSATRPPLESNQQHREKPPAKKMARNRKCPFPPSSSLDISTLVTLMREKWFLILSIFIFQHEWGCLLYVFFWKLSIYIL